VATSVVKYSSNVGLRTGVALGAVIIVVAAIVISKRRVAGMGEVTPSGVEVTGAVSPAVEGAQPEPAVEAADVTAQADAPDHATVSRNPDG